MRYCESGRDANSIRLGQARGHTLALYRNGTGSCFFCNGTERWCMHGLLPGRNTRTSHGGLWPCNQKSTYLTQLTLGPHIVQMWSRNTRECWWQTVRVWDLRNMRSESGPIKEFKSAPLSHPTPPLSDLEPFAMTLEPFVHQRSAAMLISAPSKSSSLPPSAPPFGLGRGFWV